MKYIAISSGKYSDYMIDGIYLVSDHFTLNIEKERDEFIKDCRIDIGYYRKNHPLNSDRSTKDYISVFESTKFVNYIIKKYDLDEKEITWEEYHIDD